MEHYRESKDGLFELYMENSHEGATGRMYRRIETKPPEWVGNDASDEIKQEWKAEADRRMARAEKPDVVMFFLAGDFDIPEMVFAEEIEIIDRKI